MKYRGKIDKQTFEVELRLDGDNVFASVDKKAYEIAISPSTNRGRVLICNHRVFDCESTSLSHSPGHYRVRVGTNLYDVQISDPKRLRSDDVEGASQDGSALIKAPMAGKVVRVMVENGSYVETGQPIAVVEAMKMQNEIKSPLNGHVSALNAIEGETVNAGDVLAIIESKTEIPATE